MIRVNLGKGTLKDGGKRSSGLAGALSRLELPPQILEKLPFLAGKAGEVIFGVVGAAIGAIFPLFAGQYESVVRTEHESAVKVLAEKSAALDREISKFEPFQRELKNYEEQKRLVTSRLQTVKGLLAQRAAPVAVLDAVGQALPPRTWVSALDITLSEPASVVIAGTSYANEEVSDFIERLSESVFLSEVTLQEVTSAVSNNIETKGFNITAKPIPQILTRDMATPDGAEKK